MIKQTNLSSQTDLKKIIDELDRIHKAGEYAFRGHESFKFKLLPKAFRPDVVVQMKQLLNNDCHLLNQWRNDSRIIEQIDLRAPGARRHHASMMIINRLFDYCLYLMSLNHALNIFALNNHARISTKDKKSLQLRGVEYWKDKATFIDMFTRYFPHIIRLYDTNGRLIQDANPFEDLASIDETMPQHYGAPTAALDWSFNPYVSLYFSLGDRNVSSGFLTIYTLKIHDDATDSPIKFMDKSIHIDNLRAEKQEGTFTYFTKPCSFFLRHGALPTIDYFDNRYKNGLDSSKFDLKEYRIERSPTNIGYIADMLDEMGITKHHLFPDED